jgi:lipid II:glycine glycyltransferase (peptidoglycan interpeptide bridge formation enzyme)
MKGSAESEARKALNRLRRALEKTRHELEAVRGALEHAEAADFPRDDFDTAESQLAAVEAFIDEQAERIEEKILASGGLEPGRIRRS